MSQNPRGSNGTASTGNQRGDAQQGTTKGGQQAPAAEQPNAPPQQNKPRSTPREVGGWFAETTVRIGVLLIGIVVFLFALGQALGVPLLEAVGEFFSGDGAWFAVALFALLLVVAATKSWRTV